MLGNDEYLYKCADCDIENPRLCEGTQSLLENNSNVQNMEDFNTTPMESLLDDARVQSSSPQQISFVQWKAYDSPDIKYDTPAVEYNPPDLRYNSPDMRYTSSRRYSDDMQVLCNNSFISTSLPVNLSLQQNGYTPWESNIENQSKFRDTNAYNPQAL